MTSSVDASVDASTELDPHPWRRTAAAAGGGTNTGAYYDPDDGDGEDASTLGDQNGPWIYAEPRGYEDGEYSLAGTAVSSLGVTSYNRTDKQGQGEEESVQTERHSHSLTSQSQSQSVALSQQFQRLREELRETRQSEDNSDPPSSDQAVNSVDVTANHPADGPSSLGSGHNSFLRSITRRVSDLISVDPSDPTAASVALGGVGGSKSTGMEMEDEQVDEEAQEDPSVTTSTHSLQAVSARRILSPCGRRSNDRGAATRRCHRIPSTLRRPTCGEAGTETTASTMMLRLIDRRWIEPRSAWSFYSRRIS